MLFLSFFSFPVISVCMFVSVCECELCVCEQVNAFNTVSVIKIFTIVDNFDITVWKIICIIRLRGISNGNLLLISEWDHSINMDCRTINVEPKVKRTSLSA